MDSPVSLGTAILILMKGESKEEVVEDDGDRILESRRPLGGLESG